LSGWVSVKDRLPDDRQVVDTWAELGGTMSRETDIVYFAKLNIWHTQHSTFNPGRESYGVTHWQPLPEAPTK